VIKKNISKINISKTLSIETGYPTSFSKKLIQDLIDIILQLIKKEQLILKNIGSFKVVKKKERIGRNPKTLEVFPISERKVINFIPSKKLLETINK
tara:strand:- start:274 stop:561 length:288 start_codon:yes stop_codon:yes gene_type:complete